MEFYSLTNFAFDQITNTLHFFALPMQDIRIFSGHDEMIETMLKEIGFGESTMTDWHLEHFISNYLTGSWNFDQAIDDWASHWEIRVTFESEMTNFNLPVYQHIPSWARENAAGYGQREPWWQDDCVMVANFYTKDDLELAKQMLSYVEQMRTHTVTFDSLESKLGWDKARKLLGFTFALKEGLLNQPITFRPRYEGSLQLFIYLGKYDKAYYQLDMHISEDKPVQIPQRVVTLISSLNGTILQFDHRNRLVGTFS